jgi:hypothetical protein
VSLRLTKMAELTQSPFLLASLNRAAQTNLSVAAGKPDRALMSSPFGRFGDIPFRVSSSMSTLVRSLEHLYTGHKTRRGRVRRRVRGRRDMSWGLSDGGGRKGSIFCRETFHHATSPSQPSNHPYTITLRRACAASASVCYH